MFPYIPEELSSHLRQTGRHHQRSQRFGEVNLRQLILVTSDAGLERAISNSIHAWKYSRHDRRVDLSLDARSSGPSEAKERCALMTAGASETKLFSLFVVHPCIKELNGGCKVTNIDQCIQSLTDRQ